jgi:hypothetical protein
MLSPGFFCPVAMRRSRLRARKDQRGLERKEERAIGKMLARVSVGVLPRGHSRPESNSELRSIEVDRDLGLGRSFHIAQDLPGD